ncbi:MAG TPA: hypothetical protein VHZ73_03090 [Vicinamibacterales bacterium]|nr:hypothetical protein [Vicinamibacterales bacterium]
MIPDTAAPPARNALPIWLAALLPLSLLAVFLVIVTHVNPGDALRRRQGAFVGQYVSFSKVSVTPDGFLVTVLNESEGPVTIAQVIVDDAFWSYTANRTAAIQPLASVTLTIPYPWVPGENHHIEVMTSTGQRFGGDALGVPTPAPDTQFFVTFLSVGLVVGLVPVAIGLCWLPLASHAGRRTSQAMSAFAAAVLLFLLVDSIRQALRATHLMAGAYQGIMLFVIGAAAAFVGVGALSVWWKRRAMAGGSGTYATWALAVTVAIGIGLSNLARGVEVGTDLAQGEMLLRGVTILGLTLQSVLAGATICAALAGTRARFCAFLGLVLVAGAPAVLGLWLGGLLLTSPVATAIVGMEAGGVAAAIPTLAARIASDAPLHEALATPRVVAGAMTGLVMMYIGALLAI